MDTVCKVVEDLLLSGNDESSGTGNSENAKDVTFENTDDPPTGNNTHGHVSNFNSDSTLVSDALKVIKLLKLKLSCLE